MKIHFMTPCYGGQITEACFNSYIHWTAFAVKNEVPFDLDTLSNESNVNRARNSCAAKFLAGDATHLMFVDADIQWTPDSVIKLIKHDRELVGGIYPQKILPTKMVVSTLTNGAVEGNLTEVGTMGTGFMLIKRSVFKQMIDAGVTKYQDANGVSGYAYDFFRCSVDSQGRYLTEDWTFCREHRRLGGKVWADTSIKLAHVGYHRFQPDLEQINGNSQH